MGIKRKQHPPREVQGDYRVLTRSFVCLVVVNDQGVITETAPLLRKFKGQRFDALKYWLFKTFPPQKRNGQDEVEIVKLYRYKGEVEEHACI